MEQAARIAGQGEEFAGCRMGDVTSVRALRVGKSGGEFGRPNAIGAPLRITSTRGTGPSREEAAVWHAAPGEANANIRPLIAISHPIPLFPAEYARIRWTGHRLDEKSIAASRRPISRCLVDRQTDDWARQPLARCTAPQLMRCVKCQHQQAFNVYREVEA
jgi:hypothetical protein